MTIIIIINNKTVKLEHPLQLLQPVSATCVFNWNCNVTRVKTGGQLNTAITAQPRSWYSIFCNRWLAFVGVSILVVVFDM